MAKRKTDPKGHEPQGGGKAVASRREPKRQLLLLRHAKAAPPDEHPNDKDRPLTRRGRKAAVALRKLMRSKDVRPDLVLASSSKRTLETLEELRPLAKTAKVEQRDDIYLAPAGQIRQLLRDLGDDSRSILVVGHNPGIQEFAVSLLGDAAKAGRGTKEQRMIDAFPTCALAVFEWRGAWNTLGDSPVRLKRFVRPRDF